ncbi:thiamine pyrophosphate-binding protein [Amycolatopsis cihanbeyliensis]|uniref:Thiamine pyrophosphate-dependent acetolactate synthase large subunit-like protein n=1 Tax=Amycolatopsis cihanbeyliensis TaxID=1128664 RepID=A0A542DQ60_AMYCI|nr:thiamine pyrophosphate-binding protein [Amycolatopsis cihanbeyliensis]TQJ05238.1 thiamine pyrophosphate-dependent acetolactate synthase large subunit-like protein [Amycolatopsis cihanbeyliensis]
MTTVAEAFGGALADAGVRHTFGVVGVGNVRVVAALTKAGVRYIPARHEAGAVAMADAYHRVCGEVGVCTVTYGPGLTNTATSLADAVKNRSAVVLLCGAPPGGRPRPIDVDDESFVASLGAAVVRVTAPVDAAAAVAGALRFTSAANRPVVVFLPVDVQVMPAGTLPPEMAEPVPAEVPPVPRAEVGTVMELLGTASSPLLLAGLGAWHAGAQAPIAALADRCAGLLANTLLAKGIFGDNPWSLGVVGNLSSPAAAELIGDADVILAFGTSLSEWTLHGDRLVSPNTTLVQVDLRPEQISPRTDIGIVADAFDVATALCDRLLVAGTPPSGWRRRIAGRLDGVHWDQQNYTDRSTADRIDPRTLSLALAELLPKDRTLVTDGGHFIGWPARYWSVPDPAGFVFTGVSMQSIGLGFAGAVGAATGRADRAVVLATGDGGALMGLSELETLIRTADSALIIVYDDAAYGAEVHMYRHLEVSAGTVFTDTDFDGLAKSLGAEAAVVRTLGDLDAVRSWRARGCVGTLLLDCKVVRDVVGDYLVEPRASAGSTH